MKKKACRICGVDRVGIIDRAHIIPRHILEVLPMPRLRRFAKFTNQESMNVIFLCRNHHVLFDSYRLTLTELEAITPQIEKMKVVLLEMLNREPTPRKYLGVDELFFKRYLMAYRKWRDKFGKVLTEGGLFDYVDTSK